MFHRAGVRRFIVDLVGLVLAGVLVVWAIVPHEFAARIALLWPHFLIQSSVFVLVAMALGVNRTVWRFTSLEDLGIVALSITITIVLSLGLGFVWDRLAPVFRSLPLLQGALAVFASWLVRALFAIQWRFRNRQRKQNALRSAGSPTDRDHIVIVGVNELANLYISGVAEFAGGTAEIVGLLSQEERHKGRLVQQCKVLGTPADASMAIADLAIHGVAVNRIVVAVPFESLSDESRDALLAVERRGDIELVMLSDLLGLHRGRGQGRRRADADGEVNIEAAAQLHSSPDGAGAALMRPEQHHDKPYQALKRGIDIAGSLVLSVLLLPVAAVVALLVLVNDGAPILFWQKRPGHGGDLLRVFKFRTMRGAHDRAGNKIPDAERTTGIGRFLRQSRLDELPQLYHVLVGEMSFVGPRPLLSVDQCQTGQARLSVRPGITGFAQVAGCNHLSIEEKMALDEWYVENMSLTLDIAILLKTLRTVLIGERRDDGVIAMALQARAARTAAAKTVAVDVIAATEAKAPAAASPGDIAALNAGVEPEQGQSEGAGDRLVVFPHRPAGVRETTLNPTKVVSVR